MSQYYSQNDEERAILEVFQKAGISQGKFLDIGAYDGKTFSNTHRLAELGWHGICVEPSPSVFAALLKLYESNPNVEIIQAAVAKEAGLIDFYDSGGDAISTTSVAHAVKWQKGYPVNYKRFLVYALPLEEIFRRFGNAFEFINIDVESTNLELFEALPFQALQQTRAICVEHDGNIERMVEKAMPFGFVSVYTNGENLILQR